MCFAFVVFSIGRTALQANQCYNTRYSSAYHPEATDASTKTGTNTQCCFFIHAIQVGKSGNYALTTSETFHEIFNGFMYACF